MTAGPPPSGHPVTAGMGNVERVLSRVLELAREQLGMDIAWISQFAGGEQVLRAVRTDPDESRVHAGLAASLEGSYCARVVRGALPSAVPDARADPRTRDLEVTEELGIGSYVSAPLRLSDGSVYGMLCCISRNADPSLDEKDARFLGVLASAAAEEIDREQERMGERRRRDERLRQAIDGESMSIVYQPIVDLHTMAIAGSEALARFTVEPRNPAQWFADAADAGMAQELEVAAIRLALTSFGELPEGTYLSVNTSPATLMACRLEDVLGRADPARIQLEITEQSKVEDYDALALAIERVRAAGARVAVDDAGAGYAGLRQILRLKPDVIKLDRALINDIDSDPARQALVRSLVDFAGHVGARIIAEGVETQEELDILLWLGVHAVQGYFLGRPQPLPLTQPTVAPTPRRFAVRDNSAAVEKLAAASTAAPDLEALVRPLLEAVVARTGLESSSWRSRPRTATRSTSATSSTRPR